MHHYEVIVYLPGQTQMSLCTCESVHMCISIIERLLEVERPHYGVIEIRIVPKEKAPPF